LHGHRIGYARVSTLDQNPERQLEDIPVDRLFTEKASGKDTKRPERDLLLAFVRQGDTVVVLGTVTQSTGPRSVAELAGLPRFDQDSQETTASPGRPDLWI
jgi:hypothetical protein